MYFIGLTHVVQAQIINIEDKRIKTKDSIHWYGDIGLSMTAIQVNKSVLTLRGNAQIEYKKNRHLWLSLSDYALLKAGSESFENAAFQHFRYNYKLKDALSLEFYTQVQSNKVQHIRSRVLAGTGIRWRIYKSKNKKSRLYFGIAYMPEYNVFKNQTSLYFHRLSNYLSATYDSGKNFKISSNTYYQPDLQQLSQARLSTQNTLSFKFNRHLSFKIDFTLGYDYTLPNNIEPVFYTWSNGLKWEL